MFEVFLVMFCVLCVTTGNILESFLLAVQFLHVHSWASGGFHHTRVEVGRENSK